jgi:hypothetical protein
MSMINIILELISYFKLNQASEYEAYLDSAICDKDLQRKVMSFKPAASFASF